LNTNFTPSLSSISSSSLKKQANGAYVFELFVCGMTKKSAKTIQAVKTVLEQQMPSGYQLEIFDIHKNPAAAQNRQIMTLPTLIKTFPLPARRICGDITSQNRVLCGLNITSETGFRSKNRDANR
jgi:circadian clock protein KaiB